MRVFISWSGTRSKALAVSVHQWLGTIIQRSRPWMSDQPGDHGAESTPIAGGDFGTLRAHPQRRSCAHTTRSLLYR